MISLAPSDAFTAEKGACEQAQLKHKNREYMYLQLSHASAVLAFLRFFLALLVVTASWEAFWEVAFWATASLSGVVMETGARMSRRLSAPEA